MPIRALTPVAAAVASGVALWLASPSVGVGALAWVALVPAAAVTLAGPETRLGRATVPLAYAVYLELLLVPALPFGLAHDQWGDSPVPILVGDSPVLVVALVVVPLAALALYALRFPQPLLRGRASGLGAALAAVLVPATLWTALDLLRTKFDPGGLWGPLYLSQADTWSAPVSALAGPWLLTFAIVAVGYALALALVTRRPRLAALPLALVAVAAAAGLVAGARGDLEAPVRVAAVQPGYDTAEFDLRVNRHLRSVSRDYEQATLDLAGDLAPLTRDAARRGAELAVWPEAVAWVDPAANARVRSALGRIVAQAGLALVVPYFERGPDHGAAVVVLPDGTVTRAQPKQRPMWFLGERGGNRRRPEPVEAAGLTVGTMLGVDAQDPRSPRRLAARGAELLTSSTHDFAGLTRPHLSQARLHAAALRTPLVRADWRYGSAIVAPGGDTAAAAGVEKRRTVLVADVATAGAPTPYARIGDAAGWAAVAAALVLVVAGLYAARERSESAPRTRSAVRSRRLMPRRSLRSSDRARRARSRAPSGGP